MNSVVLPSSFLALPRPFHHSAPCLHLQPRYRCCCHHCSAAIRLSSLSLQNPSISFHPLLNLHSPVSATTPSNEGTISVINFEDVMEKDWSFLETDNTNSDEEHKLKTGRIISAGEIGNTSKVLVSIGSEGFVDHLIDSSPCQQLLVVHDSLFVLACIKEKYDKIKCWQGELIYVPEKWASFDVLFLYFLPALPFELGQVVGALAKRCLPGARLVIGHPQGREVLEKQRQLYPDVIVSSLPEKVTLQNVAAENSFEMVEFVDELGFYLAVLKFKS
ncbi:hypothetical protein RJ639_004106 [Escallonia herrerae]|uniref:Uncharacterized protein n=1 Tax=Escallonia herrerae TaxID=1293975 RepID=A0AA88W4B0_9ASTE|nr:hypothetical protein RJ639_004106 [Escallonia herrerae]